MKIALISNLFEPYARGGAEIIVKRTVAELRRQGHEVFVITARPAFTKPANGDFKVYRFFPLNIFFYGHDYKWPYLLRAVWHFFDIFNIHSAWKVRQILAQEKPDLVITHNMIGLGFLIPSVIRKAGIKHIHVLHDIQLAARSGIMKKGEESGWDVAGLPARLYQKTVKYLFKSPDVVISPSKFLLDFYSERGYFINSARVVLRNPVDSRFRNVSETAKQGASEADDSNTKKLAYIGQLAEHKGLYVLKQALGNFEQARLHIVGDGPMKNEIKSWAEQDNRIVYEGRLPNEELPEFLSQVSAVILPTLTYENSPTIVFESLACNTPVIVSDIGGAGEAVIDGVSGFKVEPGNASALSEAIRKTLAKDWPKVASSFEKMDEETYVKRLLDL